MLQESTVVSGLLAMLHTPHHMGTPFGCLRPPALGSLCRLTPEALSYHLAPFPSLGHISSPLGGLFLPCLASELRKACSLPRSYSVFVCSLPTSATLYPFMVSPYACMHTYTQTTVSARMAGLLTKGVPGE